MPPIKIVTVTYSSTDPMNPTYAPHGLTRLHKNETILIKLAGNFSEDSTIDTIDFDNNTIIDRKDSKNTNSPLGSWTASGGNGPGLNGIYCCSADSPTQVTIEDIQDNEDDDKFWYSASGKIGGTKETWSIDPELINKGRP